MKRKVTGHLKNYNQLFLKLDKEMKNNSNISKINQMEKYMKNNFQFLGLSSPERRLLYKEFSKNYLIENEDDLRNWINLLWEQPYREYQYYATDDLIKYNYLFTEETIQFILNLVLRKSWWDTVDILAVNILGKYYIDKPERLNEVIPNWISHENMWMNRTAILVQLKYKEKCNLTILNSCIQPHLESNEFFIQKSIGWSLREYAKTNPDWVRNYVASNNLKPLSRREALKHIK